MNGTSLDRQAVKAARDPEPTSLLRPLLILDSITCLAFGAALVLLDDWIARIAGLPVAVLSEAGALLLVFGSLLLWRSARHGASKNFGLAVVAVNAAWVAASLAVLAYCLSRVTPAGEALVLVQAVGVAVLAILEWRAVRPV